MLEDLQYYRSESRPHPTLIQVYWKMLQKAMGRENQGVYRWLNLVNGKSYVGSSKELKVRKADHLKALREGTHRNAHFQAAWNLYGEENFLFEVMEEVTAFFWLRARETAWIDRLKAANPEFGYNIARDGWVPIADFPSEKRIKAWEENGLKKRGQSDPPETKARKKSAAQQRVKDLPHTIPSHKDKRHTAETRMKLRIAWVARKARGDHRKKGETPAHVLEAMLNGARGSKRTPEQRKQLSIAQRIGWNKKRNRNSQNQVRKDNDVNR